MMFPNSVSSPPQDAATVPVSLPDVSAEAEGDEHRSHTDYDLQPMAVHGLAHYRVDAEEGKRFHIH